MRFFERISLLAFVVLFGCAQIVAPTGGPEDKSPPEILAEEPVNLTTNFSGKEIVISFDEFIQLNSPAEQIIISPPMLRSPSYSLKKKSLVVRFEEELAENTTYTINFGEAIKDNNEGNILPNYSFVFSTGSQLDSMKVEGKLTDAITGEAVSEALVMLYKQHEDSLPLTTIPDYFTRTGSDGHFHIHHVADRPYKIFALKDENSNYLFDVPEEQIGFLDSIILPIAPPKKAVVDTTLAVEDSTSNEAQKDKLLDEIGDERGEQFLQIKMFVEEDTSQFLMRAYCEHFGKLVFVYNQSVSNFKASIDGVSFKKQWALTDYSLERDTITLWTTDVVPDTMLLLLNAGKNRLDTVEIVMKERSDKIDLAKKGKGIQNKTEKFALTLKTVPTNNRPPKPNEPLMLIWSHPILNLDLNKTKLYEDSVRVKFNLTSSDTAIRRFSLAYPWQKGRKYNLYVADSTFTDLFGLWNDSIDIGFVGADKDMFGTLSLNISELPPSQLVVELLGPSDKVLQHKIVAVAGVVSFKLLDPGKYGLRVIKDENKNGKWDSGKYNLHKQPEAIKVIKRDAEVRANWDFELDWNPNEADIE